MFAAQIVAPRRIRVTDAPEPSIDEGQIKIRMERACLCASDTPFFDYDHNALLDEAHRDQSKRYNIPFLPTDGDPYPMRVGQSVHECLGTVVESRSPRFETGDFVLALPNAQDGLVEYMVSETDRAIHLPVDSVPKEQILMTQPLGTVVWACHKLRSVMEHEVVVLGQGPMGLLWTRMLANLGARTIIAIDPIEARLKAARTMHATHTIDPSTQDPEEVVREITGGRMADLVVEAVGHQMETINQAIDLTRPLGTVLCFGVPDRALYDGFAYTDFFRKNLSLVSSVGPDVVPNYTMARDLIAQGRIAVAPLVTHVLPFGEVQEAFELFVDRKDGAIKVVLDYES